MVKELGRDGRDRSHTENIARPPREALNDATERFPEVRYLVSPKVLARIANYDKHSGDPTYAGLLFDKGETVFDISVAERTGVPLDTLHEFIQGLEESGAIKKGEGLTPRVFLKEGTAAEKASGMAQAARVAQTHPELFRDENFDEGLPETSQTLTRREAKELVNHYLQVLVDAATAEDNSVPIADANTPLPIAEVKSFQDSDKADQPETGIVFDRERLTPEQKVALLMEDDNPKRPSIPVQTIAEISGISNDEVRKILNAMADKPNKSEPLKDKEVTQERYNQPKPTSTEVPVAKRDDTVVIPRTVEPRVARSTQAKSTEVSRTRRNQTSSANVRADSSRREIRKPSPKEKVLLEVKELEEPSDEQREAEIARQNMLNVRANAILTAERGEVEEWTAKEFMRAYKQAKREVSSEE